MNKKYSFLFVFLLLIMLAFAAITPDITQSDLIQTDFNQGTYISTFYNATGFVQLNSSNTTGTYISRVFNATRFSQWNNISWYSNQSNETKSVSAIMTAPASPSPNAVWTTSNYSTSSGWNAFDGLNSYPEAWYAWPAGNMANITYDFGSGNAKTITHYNFSTGHTSQPTLYKPTAWTFEGSNDNSTWTVLDSKTGQSLTAGVFKDYSFTNTDAYRYYKFSTTAITSDSIILREMELMVLSTKLNISVRSCDDSACSGESWVAITDNPASPQNLVVANNQYFQYKIDFVTDNVTFSPELYNVTINYAYLDITKPVPIFVSPTPDNNSVVAENFTINVSITDETFTNLTLNWNGTLTVFNSTNESLRNTSATDWVFTFNQTGLIAGASYYYNLSVSDSAGNTNNTETRTIIGNAPPSFAAINNSPSSSDDLDPNTTIIVKVNITDVNSNFDSAILQWKNLTGSWTNITMSNTTAKGINTSLNASFALPLYESNITYRIFANDTIGSSLYSDNYTLQNFWDCTWTATVDLGQTAGWDENKAIGNLSINNTGDVAYSASNCSLGFRLTHDLSEGRIYYDGDYFKPSNTYTISAKSNTTITMNATFLSEVKQENAIITITERYSRSSTSSRNTTATLVSNQNGPYLYQKITSYPTEVYLTTGNFSLTGYFRNLMGSATINITNTAYNVTSNWSLPSGITNISGNSVIEFNNITDNTLNYSSINATFSSLASMTSGIKTIYFYTQGYNISGSKIVHANNQTLLSDSINITFQCYNVSDGVYVTACGSLDGDYVAPTTTTTTSTSGGGGGGGGGGSTTTQSATSNADFEFVRGKTSEIIIPFTNAHTNATMINLKFSLSGDIAKYIELSPQSIESLGPLQKRDISLKVTSPGFIQTGQQKLILSISGSRNGVIYNEKKIIILQVNDISKKEAEQLINDSELLIEKFKSENFSDNQGINRFFSEMQESLVTLNYDVLQEDYTQLSKMINSAIKSKEIIENLKELIAQMKEKGIDVSGSERIINLAGLSLSRNDFSEALTRAQQAQIAFALEIKGESANIMYYLKYKTKEISFSALLILIFGFAGYKANKIRMIRKKIRKLREEENIIDSLIKAVQKKTFEEKKMSMEEYRDSMEYYEKRLSQIIEGLIELEEKRIQVLRFMTNEKRFRIEREKIMGMIKEIQKKYLKEKKIETRTYEIRLESYNKRLGQIDEAIATLEAKRDLRKETKKMRIFSRKNEN